MSHYHDFTSYDRAFLNDEGELVEPWVGPADEDMLLKMKKTVTRMRANDKRSCPDWKPEDSARRQKRQARVGVLKMNKRARRRQKRKDERQAKAYLKLTGHSPSGSSSQAHVAETKAEASSSKTTETAA
ncbi:hypothetical protein BDV93DRAFT_543266 [Ceratobasidium sp. AG-I]|nr:hypothetical protein BDV93DRAFT_543266 [Ceratobasidium sp. AG-I]